MDLVIQENIGYLLPFKYIYRDQAAEILGVSTSSIDKYTREGVRTSNGSWLYLKKYSGKLKLTEVLEFKKALNEQ